MADGSDPSPHRPPLVPLTHRSVVVRQEPAVDGEKQRTLQVGEIRGNFRQPTVVKDEDLLQAYLDGFDRVVRGEATAIAEKGLKPADEPSNSCRRLTSPNTCLGHLTAGRIVAALLFLAFDFCTILPVAAGAYTVKRKGNIDVVRGVGMLPDELIEAGLSVVSDRIRQLLDGHQL